MTASVAMVCATAIVLWAMTLWRAHLVSETSKRVEAMAKKLGEIDARATFAVEEFQAAERRIIEHERKILQAQTAGRGLSVRV